jgi:hypothetical protein
VCNDVVKLGALLHLVELALAGKACLEEILGLQHRSVMSHRRDEGSFSVGAQRAQRRTWRMDVVRLPMSRRTVALTSGRRESVEDRQLDIVRLSVSGRRRGASAWGLEGAEEPWGAATRGVA